jgi:predicted secreted protein
MGLASSIAIFILIWWLALFMVLPWGLRTHHDENTAKPGFAESAPVDFRPLQIIARTTLIALLVFAAVYYALVYSGLSLFDLPFLKGPDVGY